MTVDLSYPSSPLVPSLSIVHLMSSSNGEQSFYYPALSPMENSLFFSFGSPIDYRSIQAGPPQGLHIVPVTGRVTWNTQHVIPGDYSAQVVTQDVETGLRVAAELRIRVSSSTQPVIPDLNIVIPFDVLYVNQGAQVNSSYSVTGGQSVTFLSPVPNGLIAYVNESNTLTGEDLI